MALQYNPKVICIPILDTVLLYLKANHYFIQTTLEPDLNFTVVGGGGGGGGV